LLQSAASRFAPICCTLSVKPVTLSGCSTVFDLFLFSSVIVQRFALACVKT
jgi:hypothetical protein